MEKISEKGEKWTSSARCNNTLNVVIDMNKIWRYSYGFRITTSTRVNCNAVISTSYETPSFREKNMGREYEGVEEIPSREVQLDQGLYRYG